MAWNNEDLIYAAAIIDGEGCIYIDKWKDKRHSNPSNYIYVSRIKVGMTDLEVPQWLTKTFGGSLRSHSRPFRRTTYIWRISGTQTIEFIKSIHPYLKIKGPQANILIEFLETISTNYPDKGQRGMRSKDPKIRNDQENLHLKLQQCHKGIL